VKKEALIAIFVSLVLFGCCGQFSISPSGNPVVEKKLPNGTLSAELTGGWAPNPNRGIEQCEELLGNAATTKYYNTCIDYIAYNEKNPEICYKSINQDINVAPSDDVRTNNIDQCIFFIAEKPQIAGENDFIEWCSVLGQKSRLKCYKSYYDVLSAAQEMPTQAEVCSQIKNDTAKADCMQYSICDSFPAGNSQDRCRQIYAQYGKYELYCQEINGSCVTDSCAGFNREAQRLGGDYHYIADPLASCSGIMGQSCCVKKTGSG